MARSVLAEGRTLDAARMIEPLIQADAAADDVGQVLLRCLMARVHLLRSADVEAVLDLLKAFEDSAQRQRLAPGIRAEVALWLGFARVWQDDELYDDARALNLLDEAARGFRDDMNASGRCWTLIGQAQAYFTIDEYQLMINALEEAAALQEKLGDVQAAMWIAHLSIAGARYQGGYRDAERYVAQLQTLADFHGDEASRGRARAHKAVIGYEVGRQPDEIIETAREATALLLQSASRPGYPLLSAYHAQIGALVRQGSWKEAHRLIDEALEHIGHLGTAPAYIALHRARIHMYRAEFERAERELVDIQSRVHRQHRLLLSNVARLQSELLLRMKDVEGAQHAAERAYRHARETGHGGYELQALLQLGRLAIHREDSEEGRRLLREMEKHGHYFSYLPYAAEQFSLQARLAAAQGHDTEARAYLTQALSARSMVGDVYGAASVQYELALLTRTSSPSECRALAEASLQTFDKVGARKEVRRLRDLIRALPGADDARRQLTEADIAAVLSRSALSVDLVAETWLRLAEQIAPQRWMGVFRYDDAGGWSVVRSHGDFSKELAYPAPTMDRRCEEGVDWIRLKGTPSPAFFFGMECGGEDDPACRVIENRLSAWAPVAGLAMEHALLRGSEKSNGQSHGSREAGSVDGLIYASDAMRRVVEKIEHIRSSHSPVFITGESGVGKNLIGRSIHDTSDRAGAPFITFNCASVARERCEAHLFGSETDGIQGAIREAREGTLFLDEIDELPMEVQPQLLRFLEKGEIVRAGTSAPQKVNVRIIAATHRDVHELIRSGHFREDLYYRLNVIPLRVPPLRERREEIPLLIQHFLRTLPTAAAQRASLSGRAVEALLQYEWPGNVRQLRNEMERALVFTGSEPAPMIDIEDLSESIRNAGRSLPSPGDLPDLLVQPDLGGTGLDGILAGAEKAVIERTLASKDGQVSAAAESLGLTRQGLYKKMKRLGIDSSRFQPDGDSASTVS